MNIYYGIDFEKQKQLLLNSNNGKILVADAIEKANYYIDASFPALKMSEFFLIYETGDRRTFEKGFHERRTACQYLGLALWLTDDEKYIKPLIDVIFYICDEFTWCLPAHAGLDIPEKSIEEIIERIDLCNADTARILTDVSMLVRDKLPEYVKGRIKYEINRRIISSLKKRSFSWERGIGNWGSVCASGIIIALIHYGEQADIDILLPRFIKTLECYLDGFGNDGCCTEGCGYWNYGFGAFLRAAMVLKAYTNSEIDFFDNSKVLKISTFPQKVYMGEAGYVSFSDSENGDGFEFCFGYLNLIKSIYKKEVILPDFNTYISKGTFFYYDYMWLNEDVIESESSMCTTFFEDAQWYVHQSEKFCFAAKAGTNNEMHNHNDIGSFMITVGGDIPLADFGRCEYLNENLFGRYTRLVNGSQGHSVPIINGTYQLPGEEYASKNIFTANNKFSFEMQDAYEHGIVKKLIRSFEIKENGILLKDLFEYCQGKTEVKERFVSYNEPVILEGKIDLKTAVIEFDKEKYKAEYSVDKFRRHRSPQYINAYLIDISPINENEDKFEFFIKITGNSKIK